MIKIKYYNHNQEPQYGMFEVENRDDFALEKSREVAKSSKAISKGYSAILLCFFIILSVFCLFFSIWASFFSIGIGVWLAVGIEKLDEGRILAYNKSTIEP